MLAAVAAFVFTRNAGLAIMAGMAAYSLLARLGWWGPSGPGSPSNSVLRTPYLELSFDRASGAISGRVLKGRFAGRALSSLTRQELLGFLAELQAHDAEGAKLFAAYLDRSFPGWNGRGGQGGGDRSGRSRAMTVDEAYLILGLQRGASADEVRKAHRDLIKRFHPDQGGTSYLASQLNEAKETILRHIKV